MNAKELEFCKYLTGHDDATIIGLFVKWDKTQTSKSRQVDLLVSTLRILALESGGDWSDASVGYYAMLKPDIDIEVEHNEYLDNGGYHGNNKKWFDEILKEKGIIRDIVDSDPLTTFYEGF